MKKSDLFFILIMAFLVLPFIFIPCLTKFFYTMTAEHGVIMSFLKFAILATAGEMLGLRISKGIYTMPGFGILSRTIVWGILGVGISFAMTVFSKGAPAVLSYIGIQGGAEAFNLSEFSWLKLLVAFTTSLFMNCIFAPIFMTLHKITDMHILANNGSLGKFFSKKIDFAKYLSAINWDVQYKFVFAKTIPLFWIPAHTLTFMLPPSFRVLFAAFLGVVLGVILSLAARK